MSYSENYLWNHTVAKYFCVRFFFFHINYQKYVQLVQALLTKYLQVLQNRRWSIKNATGLFIQFFVSILVTIEIFGISQLKKTPKPFWFANLIHYFSFETFNPKTTKGGRNQDAACLDALPVQKDKDTIIKPPCNFHFWCLKLV